jgi:NADPH-dependent ferric siderophore reductase
MPRIVDGRWTDRDDPRLLHRDYTVRYHDEQRQELWLDMDLHDGGLASRWLADAAPGDELGVLGPRVSHLITDPVDWYVFAVDTTALPALERWLIELPAEATVTVLVEVTDDMDQVLLHSDAVLDIRWLVRDDGAGPGAVLERALADLSLPVHGPGRIWAAGEAGTMARIRRDLLDRVDRRRTHVMVEGYWRQGFSNYDHHEELPTPTPRG